MGDGRLYGRVQRSGIDRCVMRVLKGRNSMKNAIRRIAKLLGWETCYHVSAIYNLDSHVGTATISMTVTVRPWIHADNYKDVVDYVHSLSERPVAMPTITSITKLGA